MKNKIPPGIYLENLLIGKIVLIKKTYFQYILSTSFNRMNNEQFMRYIGDRLSESEETGEIVDFTRDPNWLSPIIDLFEEDKGGGSMVRAFEGESSDDSDKSSYSVGSQGRVRSNRKSSSNSTSSGSQGGDGVVSRIRGRRVARPKQSRGSANSADESSERPMSSDANRRRVRGWCWTLNNYTPEEERICQRIAGEVDLRTHDCITYIIFGKEVSESGTRHLQGFLYFKNPKESSWLKKHISRRIHFEEMKGTPEQNQKYCSKDGDYTECGEIPKGQGFRADLEGVIISVKAGRSILDIANDHPFEMIKFNKGILSWRAMLQKPRTTKTKIMWFWGPTGSGKSQEAFRIAQESGSFYYKEPLSKWWDGYDQQDVVIVDDYRPDFMTFAGLLRLFDRYPLKLEFKGGITEFNSKTIIITTPKDPENTWSSRSQEDIAQLLRRIEHVQLFDVPPLVNINN